MSLPLALWLYLAHIHPFDLPPSSAQSLFLEGYGFEGAFSARVGYRNGNIGLQLHHEQLTPYSSTQIQGQYGLWINENYWIQAQLAPARTALASQRYWHARWGVQTLYRSDHMWLFGAVERDENWALRLRQGMVLDEHWSISAGWDWQERGQLVYSVQFNQHPWHLQYLQSGPHWALHLHLPYKEFYLSLGLQNQHLLIPPRWYAPLP